MIEHFKACVETQCGDRNLKRHKLAKLPAPENTVLNGIFRGLLIILIEHRFSKLDRSQVVWFTSIRAEVISETRRIGGVNYLASFLIDANYELAVPLRLFLHETPESTLFFRQWLAIRRFPTSRL